MIVPMFFSLNKLKYLSLYHDLWGNETKKIFNERATPSLVERVQTGLGEVDKEINDLAKVSND